MLAKVDPDSAASKYKSSKFKSNYLVNTKRVNEFLSSIKLKPNSFD